MSMGLLVIAVIVLCLSVLALICYSKRKEARRKNISAPTADSVEKGIAILSVDNTPAAAIEHGIIEAESQKLTLRASTVFSNIPPHRKKLLFLSDQLPRGHGCGLQFSVSISSDGDVKMSEEAPDDPSTIYLTIPVCEAVAPSSVAALPYYPSYSGMTPEQRAVYLRWLCDITQPVDIGYAFVYYYGLERHLVYGDFDAAVDEILELRKHHTHPSFECYSSSALVHACLVRKRPDKFQGLYALPGFTYFGNSNLLILHHCKLGISPETMLLMAERLQGVNRRYLKAERELYRQVLVEVLDRCFEKAEYPFAERFQLENIKKIAYPIFANISIPDTYRAPSLPNFLLHEPFQQELGGFFKEVHETVKLRLKASRKSHK